MTSSENAILKIKLLWIGMTKVGPHSLKFLNDAILTLVIFNTDEANANGDWPRLESERRLFLGDWNTHITLLAFKVLIMSIAVFFILTILNSKAKSTLNLLH